MHFSLIDRVLSRDETSLTAIKHVSAAEEYLQDHFPTYPVLPGVMMLEAMVQAARALVGTPLVLGKVGALKYGAMVRPGDSILIRVTCTSRSDDDHNFRGEVRLVGPEQTCESPDLPRAASGKLTLRPAKFSHRESPLRVRASHA